MIIYWRAEDAAASLSDAASEVHSVIRAIRGKGVPPPMGPPSDEDEALLRATLACIEEEAAQVTRAFAGYFATLEDIRKRTGVR